MRRAQWWIVTVLLCVSLFDLPVSAQEGAPTSRFLVPFLPNGERYGESGPWYGTVVLQNSQDFPITVSVRTLAGTLLNTITVDPRSPAFLPSSALFGTCREYRTRVSRHQPDGIDVIELPTSTLAVDRLEITGFAEGVDFAWQKLGSELQIDWSLPGWEPTGPYDVVVRDCPDGQPLMLSLETAASRGTAPESCVLTTRRTEFSVVKGPTDSADAVRLPDSIGTVNVVEVRYGPYYAGSYGVANTAENDTTNTWKAVVSGSGLTIDWSPVPYDNDASIPSGALYSVIVYSLEQHCLPPILAASLFLTAGAPLTATGSSSEAQLVAALPLERDSGPATQRVLPLVQRNNGWTTVIHAAHRSSSQHCAVQLELRDQQGQRSWAGSETVGPGAVWHLDLRRLPLPAGWVGSAWLTSSCGVLASATRLKSDPPLAIGQVAVAPEQVERELVVPLVYANHSNWNTGLAVTNLTGEQVTVDLAFQEVSGALIRQTRVTLAGQEQALLYRPDLPGGVAGLASLEVRASGPVAVVADAVRYPPEKPEALSLPAVAPVPPGTSLLLPLVRSPQSGEQDDATGVTIANASRNWSTVSVELWAVGSAWPTTLGLPLPPRGMGVVYLPELAVGQKRFLGTARVWTSQGPLAASGSMRNPSVPGDGAAALPLSSGWVPPLLGVELLPTWNNHWQGEPSLALRAVGLPGTPLLIELESESVWVGQNDCAQPSSTLTLPGAGRIEQRLLVCGQDPGEEPLIRVRLWWDRGSVPGEVDLGDQLITEREMRLPRWSA